jgi:soluble lytic murein transglycosylase-like protein
MTLTALTTSLVLLVASQAFAALPTNDTLLDQHRDAIAKVSGTSASDLALGCQTLDSLSKNSAHLLKAEARLQFFAFCDRTLLADPFDSAEAKKIVNDFPWLSKSAKSLRTQRLLSFSQVEIDKVSYEKIIPIYLNASKLESERQEKIKLISKIEHLLKKPAHQSNATIREVIYSIAPRFILSPRKGEHLTIARDFFTHGELLPGRAILETYLNQHTTPTAEAFAILKVYRDSFIGDDLNRTKFYAVSDKAVVWAASFGETELYLARMRQARNVSFRDNGPEALAKLDTILKMKITNVEKAEAWILVAKVHEATGQPDLAITPMNEAIRLGISGELLNRVQFDLGRLYWKLKKFDLAYQTFESYRNRFSTGSDRAKGGFWMSRSLEKLARKSEASKILIETREDDKYGYYGMIAARELQQPLTASDLFTPSALQGYQDKVKRISTITPNNAGQVTLAFLQNATVGKAPAATHDYIISLLKANQSDIFVSTATHYVASLDPNKPANLQSAQLYLEALQYHGSYLPTFAFSGAINASQRAQVLKSAPGLFYPPGYFVDVNQYSTARGLEAAMTLSVIRQESAFNAGVRSPVGAIGLMQLMPQTAATLAKDMGIKNFDPKTLFNANTNINFGTFLLDQLASRFNDRFTAVVGSYNGGPHNLDKWIKGSTAADEVEFVEDMVFVETRNYTKIVSRNMAVYKMLLNPADKNTFPF